MKRTSQKKKPSAKQSRARKLGPIARTWTPEEYEAARLLAWANQLEGLWWNATPEVRARFIDGRPLHECQMGDSERLAVAAFLRRLAETPAALEVLSGGRRRGRPSGDADDYRIALDYLATRERLGKSEAAVVEVRRAWGLKSRSAVLGAYQRGRLAHLRRPDRTYSGDPIQSELARIERSNPDMTRDELLQAISDELRSRCSSRGRLSPEKST